jgi:hypothetical protein
VKGTLAPLLVAALLLGADARAQGRPIAVEATDCPGLRAEEVERVLLLELAEVTSKSSRTLHVRMSCGSEREVRIAVDDPVTGKELSRQVPAPAPNEPGRERALGLAASQLFLASWLELLSPEAPPPSPEKKDKPASEAALGMARRSVTPTVPHRLEIVAVASALVRSLSDGPAFSLGLGARIWVAPRLALVIDPSFETARMTRGRGDVQADAFMLGVGVAARLFPKRVFDLGAELRAAGGYSRVAGQPTDGSSVGGASDGPIVDLQLAAGPTLRPSRIVISLRIVGGLTMLAPVGQIVGESDATLAGPYAGVTLELGANVGDQ